MDDQNKENEMGTALVPFDQLEKMAAAIAGSGLFGIKTPNQAMALMLIAQAEGLHPATVAQEYDIISGRPARKTSSVLARFQKAGGKVDWKELSDKAAIGTFSHPQGGSVTMEWTIERANAIKSWDSDKKQFVSLTDKLVWQNYKRAMLRSRCIAEGVRAVYPAAIGGMLLEEEARDTPPEADYIEGSATTVSEPAVPGPVAKAKPTEQKTVDSQIEGTHEQTHERSFPPSKDEPSSGRPAATSTATNTAAPQSAPMGDASNASPVAASAAVTNKNETGELISASRKRFWRAQMASAKITEEKIVEKFGKGLDLLLVSQSAEISAFINGGGK